MNYNTYNLDKINYLHLLIGCKRRSSTTLLKNTQRYIYLETERAKPLFSSHCLFLLDQRDLSYQICVAMWVLRLQFSSLNNFFFKDCFQSFYSCHRLSLTLLPSSQALSLPCICRHQTNGFPVTAALVPNSRQQSLSMQAWNPVNRLCTASVLLPMSCTESLGPLSLTPYIPLTATASRLDCPTKASRKANPKIVQWINIAHIKKEGR